MILFKLISWLPFWLLYLISDLMAFFAEKVFRYRRAVILKNLRNSFPEKSEEEIKKIKSRYYKNLTDVALETFKLLSISKGEFTRRIKVFNVEKVNALYDKNISVIATTSHLCNWEWMLGIGAIHLKAPVDAVYQEIKNSFFEKLMVRIRSRFGSIPVEKKQVFRESLKKRNIPHVIALVADQSPPRSDEQVIWAPFLNQDTVFYAGMARLAKSFKWPVVFGEMRRLDRGFYEMEFKDICLNPEEFNDEQIINKYAEMVENSIRKNPESWLWSHNRWKRSR
ncbi:MAG: lysophospholipid acyltransferase family protein [Cyclobacteriaceae bacterium]|jgi:KDO2-lipid IV(A) lauroyltransferase